MACVKQHVVYALEDKRDVQIVLIISTAYGCIRIARAGAEMQEEGLLIIAHMDAISQQISAIQPLLLLLYVIETLIAGVRDS